MAYFIDDRTLEEIRDRADIVDVISQYMDLKKAGANYKGLCPFHGEKTPSFTVSPQKKIYKCFGCGEGGNVISFVMKMEGLSFPEACQRLGDQYGVEIKSKGNIDNSYQDMMDEMYTMTRDVAAYYMKNLRVAKEPLRYLKNRNIGPGGIKRFGLGYAKNSWDDLVSYLKAQGYDLELAFKAGLIGKNKSGSYYDFYKNRIIFPIIDTKSRVLGFGARAMGDEMPKYINTADSPIYNKGRTIYGLNRMEKHKKLDRLILCEGYIDVIALDLAGIKGSVASLGTAFTPDQARLLRKYTDNLYISYDGDQAGRTAIKRALKVLHSLDWDASVVLLPRDLDPDSFIQEEGPIQYESQLKGAKSGYNFLIDDYKDSLNLNEIDDQVKLIKYIGDIIKTIKSPIERELQIKKLSKDFDISVDAIKAEIFAGKGKQPRINNVKPTKRPEKINLSQKDKDIIEIFKLMMDDKELFLEFSKTLDASMIDNKKLKEVYQSIKSSFDEEENLDKDTVLQYLRNNYIIDEFLYTELSKDVLEFEKIDKKQLVQEMIDRLIETDSINSRRDIVERIRILEAKKNKSPDEVELLNDLINKLININL
ncbi:DNA primase [Neofamilia massiliensis]|uniref:DNA primase n=1 Tax=Neofamilia massiliensis TaxID=1673724 RepID=UPI0006BB6C9D|nr:DNA primase [Neofamilia massiliensis]